MLGVNYVTVVLVAVLASADARNGGVSVRLHIVDYKSGDVCSGGDVSWTGASISAQYRTISEHEIVSGWKSLTEIDLKEKFEGILELPSLQSSVAGVQFRLLQLEHGGGSCNCWRVEEALLMWGRSSRSILQYQTHFSTTPLRQTLFCGGGPNSPREFIARAVQKGPERQLSFLENAAELVSTETSQHQHCSTLTPRIRVSYAVDLNPSAPECDGPEDLVEAVEFAMLTDSSGPWIPLRLTRWTESEQSYVISKETIRGYDVETHVIPSSFSFTQQQVNICGEQLLPAHASTVQFRWMNTGGEAGREDMWALCNVTADYINGKTDNFRVFDIKSQWQEIHTLDCKGTLVCTDTCLMFGTASQQHSRVALTPVLNFLIASKGISMNHHLSMESVHSQRLVKRSSSDIGISVSLEISPLILSRSNQVCIGGSTAGLGRTTLRLEYRFQLSEEPWTKVEGMDDISLDSGTIQFNISGSLYDMTENDQQCMQFRLVQEEHGGAFCNCWLVKNPQVENKNQSTNLRFDFDRSIGNFWRTLCRTTRANEHRILTCTYCSNDTSNSSNLCTYMADSDPHLEIPFSIYSGSGTTSCPETTPHLQIHFQVIIQGNDNCNELEAKNEGIEFSLRFDNEPWIPVALVYDTTTFSIRDYSGTKVLFDANSVNVSLRLCNFEHFSSSIQFRWLQSSTFRQEGMTPKDIWSLDDLRISYIEENGNETLLLFDSFDDEQLNSTVWPTEGRRNAILSTMCTGENQALTFGLDGANFSGFVSASRSIITASILLDAFVINLAASTNTSTFEVITPKVSRGHVPFFCTPALLNESTQAIDQITSQVDQIARNLDLVNVSRMDPEMAIDRLRNLTRSAVPTKPVVGLDLLGIIVNEFDQRLKNNIDRKGFLKSSLEIVEILIANWRNDSLGGPEVIGSSLLSVVDRLALKIFLKTGTISTGNISIRSQLISTAIEDDYITTINSSDTNSTHLRQVIQIPSELVRMLANCSLQNNEVRVISTLFNNVEEVFSSAENNTVLVSGIASTSLQCGDGFCDTQSIQLENPVIITLQHSDMTAKVNESFDFECVFWNSSSLGNSTLTIGEWSSEGCFRNEALSDANRTVCECSHLTHFAVLLSPVPLNFPKKIERSLHVISSVGVAISLVAMAITIVTFIFLRSLHNIRNYIHINLCINLMIAQLIFIVGIDRSADPVPVHCQAIAVLLHYIFLVSFMWMLMEGVVLYIVLVFVFIEKTKYYMIVFTIASYGFPLLYMGLTLPLGFALNKDHYGSTSHCFLNPETHFIWAFIAPVIVIILINIVLFLIVARVMWKHQKRRTDKSKLQNVRRWLRSAVFLVIVMGLTWIMGVLVQEVEALLPLTYIFTIMVACQGLFIFLIFVVFSQQVRDAYKKWVKAKVAKSSALSRLFENHYTTGNTSDQKGKKFATALMLKNNNNILTEDTKEKNTQESLAVKDTNGVMQKLC